MPPSGQARRRGKRDGCPKGEKSGTFLLTKNMQILFWGRAAQCLPVSLVPIQVTALSHTGAMLHERKDEAKMCLAGWLIKICSIGTKTLSRHSSNYGHKHDTGVLRLGEELKDKPRWYLRRNWNRLCLIKQFLESKMTGVEKGGKKPTPSENAQYLDEHEAKELKRHWKGHSLPFPWQLPVVEAPGKITKGLFFWAWQVCLLTWKWLCQLRLDYSG